MEFLNRSAFPAFQYDALDRQDGQFNADGFARITLLALKERKEKNFFHAVQCAAQRRTGRSPTLGRRWQVAGIPGLLRGVAVLLVFCSSLVPSAATAVVTCIQVSDEQMSLVSSDLKEGEHHLQAGNYQLAIRALRSGVERLGNEYVPPNAIDDTGQRLVLAGVEERRGHSAVAAHLLHGVLSSRISLCEKKLASAPATGTAVPH